MTQLMRHAGQKVMILFIIVHALGAYSMPYAYASPLPSPTARPSSEEGYSERELFFANGEVRLAGTLILPQGDGPFPAVVLLHGAGPDMRHVYRPDAKTFVQAGIAAFIYDKRGTGQSGGDWRTASLFDLADDALAAVRLLRQQPEILAQQVGLWGVSQGGWLTPFAAARSDQVAFIVQVTAAALPLANQEMWGVGNELHRRGFSDQALDTTMKAMHLLFSTRPLIHRGLVQLDDLWFVTYDPYLDPASAWPQVKQPALIFYGALDATVPTRTSLDVMQNFLTPGRSTIVLSDKGHGLGGPERNNNRQYVETMTNWVHAVSRSAPMPGINVSGDTVQNGELRWYGMGPMKTVWYSTAGFQLFLIGLFILVFIIGLVTSLVPTLGLSSGQFKVPPRAVLGLTSLTNLVLVAGLVVTINYLLNADAEGFGPSIPFSVPLSLLSVFSAALGLAMLFFTIRMYQIRAWPAAARAVLTIFSLVASGYILFLWYWGLLGFPL